MEPNQPPVEVRVLCRNLYLGADFLLLFTNESCPVPLEDLTLRFLDSIRWTRYRERVWSFAREIRAHQPHLVGLQEVFSYRTRRRGGPGLEQRSPGDGARGPSSSPGPEADGPWSVELDFLAELEAALAEECPGYTVADVSPASDVVLPLRSTVGRAYDLRVTDSDVILAAPGVTTRGLVTRPFEKHVTAVMPHPRCADRVTVPFRRGFGSVIATVDGRELAFANTHLEGSGAGVQEAQVRELVTALAPWTGPVVVVGDLNSHRDLGEAYGTLVAAGYRDVSGSGGDPRKHPTCCEDAFLDNVPSKNESQIDHVFVRGPVRPGPFTTFGSREGDRTPSGLWPSDHAGVMATVGITPD